MKKPLKRERKKLGKDKVSGKVLHQLDAQESRKPCSIDAALKQGVQALIPAQKQVPVKDVLGVEVWF